MLDDTDLLSCCIITLAALKVLPIIPMHSFLMHFKITLHCELISTNVARESDLLMFLQLFVIFSIVVV